jgi:hypothetical protein
MVCISGMSDIFVCSVNFKICQNAHELVKCENKMMIIWYTIKKMITTLKLLCSNWWVGKNGHIAKKIIWKKNRNNRDLGEYFLMYIMKK